MINFPNTPTLNQIYTPVAGQSYIWDGTVWGAVGRSGIPDAPIDSRQYARQDAAWVMVAPLAHGKCQLAYVSARSTSTRVRGSSIPAASVACGRGSTIR
jgi:hypothetical protein